MGPQIQHVKRDIRRLPQKVRKTGKRACENKENLHATAFFIDKLLVEVPLTLSTAEKMDESVEGRKQISNHRFLQINLLPNIQIHQLDRASARNYEPLKHEKAKSQQPRSKRPPNLRACVSNLKKGTHDHRINIQRNRRGCPITTRQPKLIRKTELQ